MEETRNFAIIFSCDVYKVVEYFYDGEKCEQSDYIHVASDRGQTLARTNSKHGWKTPLEARNYFERIKADILRERAWRKEVVIEKMAV